MTDENNAPKENTGANVEKVETIKKEELIQKFKQRREKIQQEKLTQEEIITEKMKQRV